MAAALVAVIAGFSVVSQAEVLPVPRMQSAQVQSQTVRAIQAIERKQWSEGQKLIAESGDPLAARIFYWLSFTRGHDDKNFTRLTQFIRSHPHWPGIEGLRQKAEKSIPTSTSTQEVLAWFTDFPPLTAQGFDVYAQALLASGRVEEVRNSLPDWWSSTLLAREDQKLIYLKYKNYLTLEAHKKRYDTLLFAGYYSNAIALAPILGQGYKELAEARMALANGSGGVNALIARVPAHLQNDPGLAYERVRWRRKNDLDAEAIDILMKMPPDVHVANPDEWWTERHILTRRLMEKGQYGAAYNLVSKHMQKEGVAFADAEWLSGFLALRFLNKPTLAYQHFEALYHKTQTPLSKSRGAYWSGRAARDFGQPDLAKKWFEAAAKYQTVFYGQMAGAELGLKNVLPNAAPPVLTAQDLDAFQRHDLIQASRLFFVAGLKRDSRNFLQAFIKQEKSPKAYRFAAEMAAELGQSQEALKIAKEATKEGLFLTAQSFPIITSRLKNVDVEWSLVHALIRQESLFDHEARSSAGALGLMQLMPATAAEVARKAGLSHNVSMLVSNPDHNIRLGSAYLKGLINRFDGSYPLAIAGYNAGPGRVDKWLKTFGDPRKGEIAWIDWIELIPIYETRNYVQRVLEGTYVYRLRLKDVQPPPAIPIHVSMIDH
jgi:soluble lytic murein transglycosylase